jgi:hypothetical protein
MEVELYAFFISAVTFMKVRDQLQASVCYPGEGTPVPITQEPGWTPETA